eukprot:TRINITY_DN6477_c0_g1_i4.p1 TRINITY_DN6477_c0_g1~~TRINITY_DN6477_c0_g1_i4.p1  ORF type:complete len:241 (-),score=25.49 TRINITY_DN6477_c0_g1_i4:60-782(-)
MCIRDRVSTQSTWDNNYLKTMIFPKQEKRLIISDGLHTTIIIFLAILTLITVFFFPVELTIIKHSLDSTVVIYPLLVFAVVIARYVCIIDWYFMVFSSYPYTRLRKSLTYVGTGIVLTAFLTTFAEICVAMKSQPGYMILMGVLLHPYIIALGAFLLCALFSNMALCFSKEEVVGYIEVPQMGQFREMDFMPSYPQPAFAFPAMHPMEIRNEDYYVNAIPMEDYTQKPVAPYFIPYYVAS